MTVPPFEGRVPPHDLDSEAAVLSAVLIDWAVLDGVADLIDPKSFYSESHRWIFDAMLAVAAQGKAVDIVSVGTHLKTTERIKQVGGMSYLTEILNCAPAVANARTYAKTVRDKYLQRRALEVLWRALGSIYAGVVDASEFFDDLERRVHEITSERHKGAGFERIGITAGRELQKRREAEKSGVQTFGIPTGYRKLDATTGGLFAGDLTVLSARPGMGKTSLMMGIATNVACIEASDGKRPYGVAVFSLEMPKEQLAMRTVCSQAGIDVRMARSGAFSEESWRRINNAYPYLNQMGVFIDDAPARSLESVRSSTRRLQSELAAEGKQLGLVCIDYLTLMKMPAAGSKADAIGVLTAGLKSMAKELKVPVILLAQLNRELEHRPDKRPTLPDLRGSGDIEQDADAVLFIYRDDYYNAESMARGRAEIIIAKQRNGPLGTEMLGFEKETTSFYNLPEAA